MEDVRARHKKELKALEGNGRRLLKQANKNRAKIAEAEAKVAKVGVTGHRSRAHRGSTSSLPPPPPPPVQPIRNEFPVSTTHVRSQTLENEELTGSISRERTEQVSESSPEGPLLPQLMSSLDASRYQDAT